MSERLAKNPGNLAGLFVTEGVETSLPNSESLKAMPTLKESGFVQQMDTLLNWTGNKVKELGVVFKYLPENFNRFAEPFVGSGAVFFGLNLEGKSAVINDKSADLVNFYKLVAGRGSDDLVERMHTDLFRDYLMSFADIWEATNSFAKQVSPEIASIHYQAFFAPNRLRSDDGGVAALQERIADYVKMYESIFLKELRVPDKNGHFSLLLAQSLAQTLVSATNKIEAHLVGDLFPKNTNKNTADQVSISNLGLDSYVHIAVKKAVYNYIRDLYNSMKNLPGKEGDEERVGAVCQRTASYFFLRQFAFQGMHRYSQKGDFNVPMRDVNLKEHDSGFRKKVENLFTAKVADKFKNTEIQNMDFEELFAKLRKNPKSEKETFIFLDPPYDGEFDGYDGSAFGVKDQERLFKQLARTKAKFMMVVKKTPLMDRLYCDLVGKNPEVNLIEYPFEYKVNMRGRNSNRGVTHMMIRNYR